MVDLGVVEVVLGLVVALLVGVLVVVLAGRRHANGRASASVEQADGARLAAQREADEIRAHAEADADDLRRRASKQLTQATATRAEVDDEVRAQREDLHAQRLDVERREHRLADREERLDVEVRHLDERAEELQQLEDDIDRKRADLAEIEADRRAVLERAASLTAEQAKAELVAGIENDAKRQAVLSTREIERAAQEEGEFRARAVLATVIQRLASEQTSESVVSLVHLPGDDMKGRIIGREGRNIRTFEQTTGVNLIIDDTPEAVLLSCFDPVRREAARLTLEALVFDGRIHPSRIEETHQRSAAEVDRLCQRAGEDAATKFGITDLHPTLVQTLGQLRYRTSYGQNVLKHLVESAHAGGMMADEIGIDRTLVVRAALLHDIGKALSHEHEGSHAIVGADLARRYGEHADVVHAIEAHHNEVEPRTVEAVLTQAADAVSGGRPGARRESLESYVQRLHRLEEIALSRDGVEKVFAMQAGRDVRVMVLPDVVDDIQAQVLARDIAKQVEEELTYPGQIKITVVRESRASEVAR
ncbi:MAG TPA: ribonuclease Y [Nocardioidaceae bacterium]|nr:ribonuclease Y [Nocardioidaceae bacterium]